MTTWVQSPEIDKLLAALSAAQGEFEAVDRTANNPFFKSKYADLPAVVKAASPILYKHGLAVSQLPDFDGTCDLLTTLIGHESGQWIRASARLHPAKDDAQGIGSATTYQRRYSYSGGLSIVTEEDDDGNAASRGHQEAPRREAPVRRTAPKPAAPASAETGELASQKQLGMIAALFRDKGFPDDKEVRHTYTAAVVGREFASAKELSKKEASAVIEALMAEEAGAEPEYAAGQEPY